MNYKKMLILIILCISIVNILIVFGKNNNKNLFIEGTKLAINVDGVSQDNFPTTGEYDVNVECTNITGTWNYEEWKLELSNVTGDKAICNINFTSFPNKYNKLNSKILNLVNTVQGTGKIVNENGYRYEGNDPNNYVLFNEELWRIIGVFDDKTHGVTGQYLTKIIRDEHIGSYSWDTSYPNNWSTSNLKTILNTYYYNREKAPQKNECFYRGVDIYGNCDFSNNGLNERARNMIQSVTWKLGGHNTSSISASAFYEYERSTTVNDGSPTVWNGNVGLLYPSDYGYSVLSSSCPRTTNLDNYNTSACGGQSWLLKYGYMWTMTQYISSSDKAFYIFSNGNLMSEDNFLSSRNVRPTVYLKSSVYIISGDGSMMNPYKLGV